MLLGELEYVIILDEMTGAQACQQPALGLTYDPLQPRDGAFYRSQSPLSQGDADIAHYKLCCGLYPVLTPGRPSLQCSLPRGVHRVEEGANLTFLGPYEVVRETLPKMVLRKDECPRRDGAGNESNSIFEVFFCRFVSNTT